MKILGLSSREGDEMTIRTEKEIQEARNQIKENKELTYSYREDIEAVLLWFLGGDEFDGLPGNN